MDFSTRAKELFEAKWPKNSRGDEGMAPEEGVSEESVFMNKSPIPICYRCGHATHVYLSGDSKTCLRRIHRLSSMDCPKCHLAKMTQAKTKPAPPNPRPLNPVLRETIIISRFLLWLAFRIVKITVIVLLFLIVGGCYYCAGKKYPNVK